MSMNRDSTSDQ